MTRMLQTQHGYGRQAGRVYLHPLRTAGLIRCPVVIRAAPSLAAPCSPGRGQPRPAPPGWSHTIITLRGFTCEAVERLAGGELSASSDLSKAHSSW